MKYHFIVNPKSGNGTGLTVWNKAEAVLKQKNVDYDVYMTKRHLDAQEKAAELTADMKEEAAVIVVGGDGTIDEAVNGLNLDSPVIFGFIPSGSGNDLGRSFGFESDTEAVVERIIGTPNVTAMDFGVLTLPDGTSRRFTVSCGIGFDAAVCHALDASKAKDFFNKLHVGKAGYTAVGFLTYLKTKASKGYVILDGGQKTDLGSIFFISIQNHRYEGGGYLFSPNAVWNDGKIDVTTVDTCNKLRLFPILIDKQKGLNEDKYIHFFTCKEVQIHVSRPLAVHSDGENMGMQTDFSVRCEHGKLRVFA